MEIRYKLFNDMAYDKDAQKALSLALCLRAVAHKNVIIRNFSPNKIRALTGCSAKTFKKYLPKMLKMGLVSTCGKHDNHLSIKSFGSRRKKRNINIEVKTESFRKTYEYIRALVFTHRVARKRRIERLLQALHDPKTNKEFKKARDKMRRLVKNGILHDRNMKYDEYGYSFKGIAKAAGVCVRTAQRIVKYAIKKRWVKKENHADCYYAPGISFSYVEWATYTNQNFIIVVKANTYQLSKRMETLMVPEARKRKPSSSHPASSL